ncbi:MAG: UDP-N-acetylmuramoyl-L-alanine--D-glutamate ligase [Candidatus Pacebacteria bacterium]|nr:UDP-N-acetylmuramoyl-L-alanine--D-glutamate ligase [Candidatus Paceibacterota bacterium]
MENKILNYKEFFKGKKITVMGLGLLGRGVGDAMFLAECGAELIITDLKSSAELRPSLQKLLKYKNIKYTLGEHKLADFQNRDIILKSAGVPFDSVCIAEANKNRIPVEMSAALFARFSNVPMIGITGTRGKSTVTNLIAHLLKKSGQKVILGGNVQGVSNLQLLKKSPPKQGGASNGGIAVFELDSWQLQGFNQSRISPAVAVFTTFFPDHMKYYGNDMKKYYEDKASIFKYQNKNDLLVMGSQALPFFENWKGEYRGRLVVAKNTLPVDLKISMKGEHNVYNAMLAVEVVKRLGVKDEVIKKALRSFKGVPGRLELVRDINGVKYYNDTTATTPEATIAALQALGVNKNVILIAGGSDKGLDMSILLKDIPKYTKTVFLLAGNGTETVKGKIANSVEVKNLKQAVTLAKKFAKKGDVILLSPAFASFGMFQNEYDRGEQFNKIVKGLK